MVSLPKRGIPTPKNPRKARDVLGYLMVCFISASTLIYLLLYLFKTGNNPQVNPDSSKLNLVENSLDKLFGCGRFDKVFENPIFIPATKAVLYENFKKGFSFTMVLKLSL